MKKGWLIAGLVCSTAMILFIVLALPQHSAEAGTGQSNCGGFTAVIPCTPTPKPQNPPANKPKRTKTPSPVPPSATPTETPTETPTAVGSTVSLWNTDTPTLVDCASGATSGQAGAVPQPGGSNGGDTGQQTGGGGSGTPSPFGSWLLGGGGLLLGLAIGFFTGTVRPGGRGKTGWNGDGKTGWNGDGKAGAFHKADDAPFLKYEDTMHKGDDAPFLKYEDTMHKADEAGLSYGKFEGNMQKADDLGNGMLKGDGLTFHKTGDAAAPWAPIHENLGDGSVRTADTFHKTGDNAMDDWEARVNQGDGSVKPSDAFHKGENNAMDDWETPANLGDGSVRPAGLNGSTANGPDVSGGGPHMGDGSV